MKRHHTRARLIALSFLLALVSLPAAAQLYDNGDGTITDPASGLMWLKNANMNGPMEWATANAWAQNLSFAGYSDWRLPSGADLNNSSQICNSAVNGANCQNTEFATLYFARLIMAFNPGPFQNVNGNYWTSTEEPGNANRAMAQDFIDGGQNPFAKTAPLGAWAVRSLTSPPNVPILYGVVSQAPNAGYLVKIDTQTGGVALVGDTGYPNACGLAYDSRRARLLLSPCFGQAAVRIVNPLNVQSQPLGTAAGLRPIAYRSADDRIYSMDISPSLMSIDAATGTDPRVSGYVNQLAGSTIAARPLDGQLFGTGLSSTNAQNLFKLNYRQGSGPRDTSVGNLGGSSIGAITFHPDGRLFAMNRTTLLTLNPNTGATTQSVPLTGTPIGLIGGLAVVNPVAPDIWIKDCKQDTGSIPSSPTPCADIKKSPDIMIDNNNDGQPDYNRFGTNIVRITVRNRNNTPASQAVVRLYFVNSPNTSSGAGNLVGQSLVDLNAVGLSDDVRRVAIPWRAQSISLNSCLVAELDHPNDRVLTSSVAADNNKAMLCLVSIQRVPRPIPLP